MIYMIHPKHGATYVLAQDDVKRLEPFGWVVAPEPKTVPTLPMSEGTIRMSEIGVRSGRRRQ
jgi:hypothetical protein